ncbi:sulfatase-like hydrolase/transferase [Uliginosibacterium sp. H3]|uniref:Sulfatase-like hydrolase/transferase n=1 Tax=Uliginosibacterium silvisoli TaxID=3114758 RepID=A0ABU6K8C6_9RHOO|nr:sulfatase-like hydrolase/transferase [Uliginosibacterium sp. H3]
MSTTQPNIIFILADDLGYADLSVYGQNEYDTPHLDKLAGEGVRFTQAYANSAVCSATRFALITGRYQYRLRGGLEEPLAGTGRAHGLPPEHPTLPSLLRDAGYTTALIGKWHLGQLPSFGPLKSGYDRFFGNYGGAIDYFTHKPGVGDALAPDLYEGEVPVERTGYYTQILGDEGAKYIRESTGEKPFFLSLHFTAPHWPWVGPEDEAVSRSLDDLFHYDGGNLKIYAKIVQALDAAVGQVTAALDERGIADNTIVIFTSDNGGERFSKMWPFTGQKTELLEGGLRVPTILRWPARIAPQVQEQVTITMDWLPTLLDAAGAKVDADYPPDGESILPVLTGSRASYPRQLYWRYKANAQRAVRDGNWKYLKINDQEFLFDVVEDVRERANLKDKQPEVFQQLRNQWESWNSWQLPLNDEIYSAGVSPDIQADRYVPEAKKRRPPGTPLS